MVTGRSGRSTRRRGSNGAGNDEDGGQHDRKCSKKTNVFYFDVGQESVNNHDQSHDHGDGHDVVPMEKAEDDLGQNHLTTESLCHCGQTWEN